MFICRFFFLLASMLASASSFAASLPDLVPASLSYNRATQSFTSVITNKGIASTPMGVTIGVAYFVDGIKCTWGAVDNISLAPGASVSIGSQGGTCAISNGTHTIAVMADDAQRIIESTRTNDSLSQTITIGSVSSLPDLVPTSLSYNSATGNFTSVIANQGTAPTSTGATIGVAYLVDGVKCTWGYVNQSLDAGKSVTIGTQGGMCSIANGTHKLSVVADDVNRITELNKSNNTLTSSVTIGVSPNTVPLSSLTNHNMSAFNAYNKQTFPANFGTASYISQSQTVGIDPSKMDRSMNAVTPGHVSRTDVHKLIPSRPDLRWFVHLMPWYSLTSCDPLCIGLDVDTSAYVQSLITDLKNRGFNGVIICWNGAGTRSDDITKKIKAYIETLPTGSFSYIVLIDQGLIDGYQTLSARQTALESGINYIKAQYFNDPNYETEGGKPVVLFYGVRYWTSASVMSGAKADTGGNMFWADVVPASYLDESWSDASYDWHDAYMNGVNPADPYNLSAIRSFYSAVAAHPGKQGIAAMSAKANGTLANWASGMYLPQDSGKALAQRAQAIDSIIPMNVKRVQWVTWNDYPEGTAIEMGIDNNFVVTPSIQGTNLNWTFTSGTGDESTIDHYEIYASADGLNAIDLGSVQKGLASRVFSLAGLLASGTHYNLYVNAVGISCIRDHLSSPVSYIAP